MQFVNDDMDDELYRRAAEEYPLKTEGADWNKLREKLNAAGGNNSGKKKNRRGIILLLALIPLLLICTTYINTDHATNKFGALNQSTKNDQTTAEENNESSLKENDFNNTIHGEKRIINEELDTDQSNIQKLKITTSKSIAEVGETYEGNRRKQKTENGLLKSRNRNFIANGYRNGEQKDPTDKENAANREQLTQQETMLAEDKKSSTDKPATPKNTIATTDKDGQSIKNDSSKAPQLTASSKEKLQFRKSPKFYLGIQAGPDFSMVKSANTSKAGYSVGLIAGYNLSKRFAIETGFLWDQKRYNAEGRDFKTDKLNWPHVTILNLSGYCNMFEIPVNVRYNFISAEKTTFFANAGISSYLMKKENYDYHYQSYGVYGYGNKEYKNTTNNLLSVAHLSVGIQKKLGLIGDLRIEPYVKLPLNGVGIGSMPLRSTGIYLGITRPIR